MIRIEHNEEKWAFPFVEYIPTDADKKLPLIIQLHGAGERGLGGDDLKQVDVHGLSKLLMNNDYECRVVMPQCPPDTFWAARVESIISFIEMLKAEFDTDEDKVYLTGLSMGGFGTWYTAMAKPDLFAAIVPICGGGMPWNAGVLDMPVWAFHGTADSIVLVSNSDDMVDALKKLGKDVTYSRLDNVEHNAWDYAYNDTLIKWFLDKKRK